MIISFIILCIAGVFKNRILASIALTRVAHNTQSYQNYSNVYDEINNIQYIHSHIDSEEQTIVLLTAKVKHYINIYM